MRRFPLRPAALQTFVLTLTASQPINSTDVSFNFSCDGTASAPIITGVNTLLFSASNTPVPDIVALAAADGGIVNIPGATGTGAFAVATVNLGSGDTITASADTGGALLLPVTLSICETTATGACLGAARAKRDTDDQSGRHPDLLDLREGQRHRALRPCREPRVRPLQGPERPNARLDERRGPDAVTEARSRYAHDESASVVRARSRLLTDRAVPGSVRAMRFEVELSKEKGEMGETFTAVAVAYPEVTATGRTEKEALGLLMEAMERYMKKKAAEGV